MTNELAALLLLFIFFRKDISPQQSSAATFQVKKKMPRYRAFFRREAFCTGELSNCATELSSLKLASLLLFQPTFHISGAFQEDHFPTFKCSGPFFQAVNQNSTPRYSVVIEPARRLAVKCDIRITVLYNSFSIDVCQAAGASNQLKSVEMKFKDSPQFLLSQQEPHSKSRR